MIAAHFKAALTAFGFAADTSSNKFTKQFPNATGGTLGSCELRADFAKQQFFYPEAHGLTVNERQYRIDNNFVDCVIQPPLSRRLREARHYG